MVDKQGARTFADDLVNISQNAVPFWKPIVVIFAACTMALVAPLYKNDDVATKIFAIANTLLGFGAGLGYSPGSNESQQQRSRSMETRMTLGKEEERQ